MFQFLAVNSATNRGTGVVSIVGTCGCVVVGCVADGEAPDVCEVTEV